MSYFHNSYSSLEDAWGDNLKKKFKKNFKDQSPICNLYNKRDSKPSKPYSDREIRASSKSHGGSRDVKYTGYKDAHKYTRKADRLSEYKLEYPYENPVAYDSDNDVEENMIPPIVYNRSPPSGQNCYTTNDAYGSVQGKANPKRVTFKEPINKQKRIASKTKIAGKKTNGHFMKNQYAPIEEESSEEYMDEDSDEDTGEEIHQKKNLISNESDSEDEFDSYLESKMFKRTVEAEEEYDRMISGNSVTDEIDSELGEEEGDTNIRGNQRHKRRVNNKRHVNNNSDNYLELVLFTVSGVILIFIMEQFVQMGMKLKKINTPL
jgi:hypothetical protein